MVAAATLFFSVVIVTPSPTTKVAVIWSSLRKTTKRGGSFSSDLRFSAISPSGMSWEIHQNF